MALATYSDLQAAIAGFLNRDDLTSVVPDFIALAEAAHARDIRHWRMETRATTPFSDRYTDLPEDWLETLRLTMGNAASGYRALALVSRDQMERMRAGRHDAAGVPQYYAHPGGGIEVFPTPTEEYASAELLYIAKVPALSDSATTNWLLTAAPDAYLYGALIHSAPYLVADPRIAVWGGLYGAAVQALNASGKAATMSGTSLRIRPPR